MVSNADFFRVLLGAATRPLNVLVLAFMLAAAIVVSPWIALAAVPVYGLLVWTSARDDAGPASTGPRLRSFDLQQLSPALQPRVAAARREQQAVLDELSRLEVAPEGVGSQSKLLSQLVCRHGLGALQSHQQLRSNTPKPPQRADDRFHRDNIHRHYRVRQRNR